MDRNIFYLKGILSEIKTLDFDFKQVVDSGVSETRLELPCRGHLFQQPDQLSAEYVDLRSRKFLHIWIRFCTGKG